MGDPLERGFLFSLLIFFSAIILGAKQDGRAWNGGVKVGCGLSERGKDAHRRTITTQNRTHPLSAACSSHHTDARECVFSTP
jgi:hypothetical protein